MTTAIDRVYNDLAYSVRTLGRSPVFVLVSTLSLAVGIAGAIALYAFVDAALLRPKPHVREDSRLVAVFSQDSSGDFGPLSYPDIEDLGEQTEALQGMAAVGHASVSVRFAEGQERTLSGEQVSDDYFRVLGVPMALGRPFLPEDLSHDTMPVILGHHIWERYLGSDPTVVGGTLRVDGLMRTVIGIAPAGLEAADSFLLPDIWIPVSEAWRSSRGTAGLRGIGRLANGEGFSQAESQAAVVAERLATAYPRTWKDPWGQQQSIAMLPWSEARVPPGARGQILGTLALLSLLVLLVLMVGGANVAGLLLVRATARSREIAVRLALGAARRHLVRQMLVESVVLATLAGSLALFLLHAAERLISSSSFAAQVPVAFDLGVDWRIALFGYIASVLVGLVFGIPPALHASRTDLVPALRTTDGSGAGRRSRLRTALVVAQIAGSLALILAAGTLLRALQRATVVDLGFEPDGVIALTVDPVQRGYSKEETQQLYADLGEHLRAVPGVESTALSRTLPLGPLRISFGGFEPEGYEMAPGTITRAGYNAASPGYFRLLRMTLLQGREFSPTDSAGSAKVAIVNRAFTDRYWHGENPVGRMIRNDKDTIEVVGLVDNAQQHDLVAEPEPHLWVPVEQAPERRLTLLLRFADSSPAELEAVRASVHAVDRRLPITDIAPLRSIIKRATDVHRATSAVTGAAGSVTLALAMLGVYGIVAFELSGRRHELGIRTALGASAASIVWLVVRRTLGFLATGVGAGLAIGGGATFVLSRALYGVEPLDPIPLAGAITLLALACVGATLPVAARAAATDPVASLRSD